MWNKMIFYVLKLPSIYILIVSGFIFEFIIGLPFLVLCAIDNIFDKKQWKLSFYRLRFITFLVRLAGFEPAAYGLEVRCSIQLSYRRIL